MKKFDWNYDKIHAENLLVNYLKCYPKLSEEDILSGAENGYELKMSIDDIRMVGVHVAVKHFEPDNAFSRLRLGERLMDAERYDEAIDIFSPVNSCTNFLGVYDQASLRCSICYIFLQMPKQAADVIVSSFINSKLSNIEMDFIYSLVAVLYVYAKEYELATRYFEFISKNCPEYFFDIARNKRSTELPPIKDTIHSLFSSFTEGGFSLMFPLYYLKK